MWNLRVSRPRNQENCLGDFDIVAAPQFLPHCRKGSTNCGEWGSRPFTHTGNKHQTLLLIHVSTIIYFPLIASVVTSLCASCDLTLGKMPHIIGSINCRSCGYFQMPLPQRVEVYLQRTTGRCSTRSIFSTLIVFCKRKYHFLGLWWKIRETQWVLPRCQLRFIVTWFCTFDNYVIKLENRCSLCPSVAWLGRFSRQQHMYYS